MSFGDQAVPEEEPVSSEGEATPNTGYVGRTGRRQ